jgi:hypothetical protein
MKSQRITRHWIELSAYMDGQLPANKAARLEKRLSADSALRAEYEDLLRTRRMLRGLPKRRVPRNFTLTPDMVRAPHRKIFNFLVPALRFSSSAAALMLALTFALEFMGGGPLMAKMAQDAAPAPAMEMMMEEAPAEAAEEPMILLWDEQPEPGLGGGIAPEVDGLGGGPQGEILEGDEAMAEAMPMEESAPAAEVPMPAAEAEEEAPAAMAMEAPAEEAPAANAVPQASPTAAPLGTERAAAEEEAPVEKTFADETHEAEAPDTGSADSIILGIPPEEEQGQIQVTEPPIPAPLPEGQERMPVRRWLQISLGAFAVVAMLISFLIPRKRY